MTKIGADGINTRPCSPEDEAKNWQVIKNTINQLFEAVNNISVAFSDHKVAVNDTDNTNLTFDYLHAKVNDNDTYAIDLDLLVMSETVGDLTERFFVKSSNISGFSDPGTLLLTLADDKSTVQWTGATIVSDTFKVKATGTDSTEDYFHNTINDNATYVGGADIIVASATVGAAASNQKERLFVDVSAISGWAATGEFVLRLVGNTVQWGDFSTIIAGDGCIVVSYSAGVWTISLDLTKLAGYDSTQPQVIGHEAGGAVVWKTLSSQVINNPNDDGGMGTTLELNDQGTYLESKLHYHPITILVWTATTGAAAVYEDRADIGDCTSV
jgi:hypothetical protein